MASDVFTAPQEQVLTLLASGSTMAAAAEAAGVHRNTVSNWRRSSASFRQSLESARYQQAMHWRDQLQPIAPLAIFTLKDLLTDPKTSASIRLRAALTIFSTVSTPEPPEPDPGPACQQAVHNSAQIDDAISPAAEAHLLPAAPSVPALELVHSAPHVHNAPHNPAQSRTTLTALPGRRILKMGRNETCSCGSGLKYKRCCFLNPPVALAA